MTPLDQATHTDNAIEADRFERYRRIADHDFPLEFLIAGELAQFQTYAIPSIARLLHRTGQYEQEGLKRLDDTRATMTAIFSNPEGSAERQAMITHLNWIHSHYAISNEDSLYTLLRMFLNPVEWVQRWGWRELSHQELDMLVAEMVSVGKAMGIRFEDETFEGLNRWQMAYREEYEHFHPDNQAVALGTIEGLKGYFPRWLQPVVPVLVSALLEDRDLLRHLGLSPAPRMQQAGLRSLLTLWRWGCKVYRPWKHRPFSEGWLANRYPSYQDNRLILCQLGPRKLIRRRNARSGCPFH
ncbi:MAG: oxygenase MpaB family protein [Marinobacter sp.]|nr:oxygenase MpaB family protein [Marinobacter sp.]